MRKKPTQQTRPGRKRRFRNRRYRKTTMQVPRGVRTGLNINPIQRQRYVQYITLTSTTGTIAVNNFAANGMHDPDLTGAGHQPLRWDQMKLFYNHYIVLGSKITVTTVGHITDVAGNMVPAAMGIYLDDSTTNPSTYQQLIEQGRTRYTITNQHTGEAKKKVSNYYSCKKFFNVKDVKDNVTRLGAANSANPSDLAVFNLWLQALDGSSTTSPVQCIVQIDYICLYSEPTDLAQS